MKNNRSTPVSHVDDTRSTGWQPPPPKVSLLINSIHGGWTSKKFLHPLLEVRRGQQSPPNIQKHRRISLCAAWSSSYYCLDYLLKKVSLLPPQFKKINDSTLIMGYRQIECEGCEFLELAHKKMHTGFLKPNCRTVDFHLGREDGVWSSFLEVWI